MLVRAGVFNLIICAIVDDEAKITHWSSRRHVYRDIEIDTIGVGSCDGDLATAIRVVLGRVVKCVERPIQVVIVGTEVVDSNVSRGDGGFRLSVRGYHRNNQGKGGK
jgi:hypothetical protein